MYDVGRFHPPYELSFPYHWKEFAVFVRRADAKDIPDILRRISHEQYLKMHKILQFAGMEIRETEVVQFAIGQDQKETQDEQ